MTGRRARVGGVVGAMVVKVWLGASLQTGVAVALAAGVVVLVLAWRASGDLANFTLSLAAALVASPIVWAHLWLVPYLSIGALLWPTLRLEFILASAISLAVVAIVTLHIARPDPRPQHRLAQAGRGACEFGDGDRPIRGADRRGRVCACGVREAQ